MNPETRIMNPDVQSAEMTRTPHLDFDSIVIISPYVWLFRDGMWQTTHQIAREFARIHPTIFVESSAPWNPRADWFFTSGVVRSLVGPRTSQPDNRLTVFHRRGYPLGRLEAVKELAIRRNSSAVRHLMKKMGFRNSLLWHSFPYSGEHFVDTIPHQAFAYHCLDHSEQEEEPRLICKADAVFSVSDTLVQKHKKLNRRSYLLPNGVDLRLFSEENFRNGLRPTELPTGGRVIGFIGALNYHLDLELLVKVAAAFPQDCLVVVGKIPGNHTIPSEAQLKALGRLHGMPNVRMAGFVPTRDLPAYIQAFDVCLIPFLQNPFNMECDPLKFYQYMSSGKPVVTTPVTVALENPALCYLAQSHDEFLSHISTALTESGAADRRRKRLAFARSHSWEALPACPGGAR